MKTVFDFKSCREFLIYYCHEVSGQRGFQATLAKAAGCQASYFSQALKGNVQLSEDQALGVARHLHLSADETEYFFNLVRWAKAGSRELKEFLETSMEKIKKTQLNLTERVQADHVVKSSEDIGHYTSSWIPSVVHLLTSSSEFQTVESIATRLHLSPSKVTETLHFLQRLQFVKHEHGRWQFNNGSIHLPKDSPWNQTYQTGRRHLAIKAIHENHPDSVHFSSVFTMDKKDVEQFKKLLSKCVEKSHDLIKRSGTEELFAMCLDFFVIE